MLFLVLVGPPSLQIYWLKYLYIIVLAHILVNNEKPRKETGGEWDEDAAMDVWSHEER